VKTKHICLKNKQRDLFQILFSSSTAKFWPKNKISNVEPSKISFPQLH